MEDVMNAHTVCSHLYCVWVCVYDVKACVSVSGPGHMADAAQLPVREAADSGGGVHLLAHTLWRQRSLAHLSGPDQLGGEERDPLLLP